MGRKRRGHDETAPTPAVPMFEATPRVRPNVFAIGDVIAGRYRVIRPLAAGGMGEVYAVHDTHLDEVVALKTIRGDVPDDPAMLERFKREIQLARKVTHPNVCRIFDVGFHRPETAADAAAVPVLTMELVGGETLAAHLRRSGRMPTREVLPLVEQMAAGLDAAHRVGIIHRDFKSSNVMLVPGPDGHRVVITDFGLAKALAAQDSDATTLTGQRPIGTPAYMAPEQVTGESVDERCDIYALGVVIFEMVTGRVPFLAETPMAMAVKRVTETPPSAKALVPELASDWAATIGRCLARYPTARFASALDVVRALHGHAPPDPARWRRRLRRALLPLGAIVAVLLGALVYRQSRTATVPRAAMPPSTWPLATTPKRPPPTGTPYQRAVEHLRRWEGTAARELLEDVVAAAPTDANARLALCQANLMTRDLPDALTVAQRVVGAKDSSGVPAQTRRLLEACSRSARSDDAGAAALYGEAFAANPEIEIGIQLALSQRDGQDANGLESTLAKLQELTSARWDPRLELLEASARNLRGDYADARARYAHAAEVAEAEGLPMIQAAALFWEATMLRNLGELRVARELADRVHALYAEAGERGHRAEAMNLQSWILYDLGQHRRNVAFREQMLELAQQAGDQRAAINVMMDLASSRFLLGDHRAGRRGLEEAFELAKALRVPIIDPGYMRGWELLHAGEALASIKATRQAMRPYPTDRYYIAYMEWDLGEASLLAGDLPAARAALAKATDVASQASFFTSAECTRVLLAMTALAEGNAAEAETLSHRAVRELDRMGVRDCRVRGRVVRARALRVLGKAEDAHAILADAEAISTEDVWIRWEMEVALAEDELARYQTEPARARLQRVIDEAANLKMPHGSLAAAVVLGELELSVPDTAARGKARVESALAQARKVGQGLVAKRALAALGRPR